MPQDRSPHARGWLARLTYLGAAVVIGGFGMMTMWSGVNTLSLVLFGAALVLAIAALTGRGPAEGGRSVGAADVLAAALMIYAGSALVQVAAREYRASRRLTDPGNDFVVEGTMAAAGAALILAPGVVLLLRRRS